MGIFFPKYVFELNFHSNWIDILFYLVQNSTPNTFCNPYNSGHLYMIQHTTISYTNLTCDQRSTYIYYAAASWPGQKPRASAETATVNGFRSPASDSSPDGSLAKT